MAHLIQTGPTRTELVAQALKRVKPVPQQVQSVGEGFTRLGSQLVDTFSQVRQVDKRLEEQQERQTEQSAALAAALRAGLEGFTTTEGVEIPAGTRATAAALGASGIPELAEQGVGIMVQTNIARTQEEARIAAFEREKELTLNRDAARRQADREEAQIQREIAAANQAFTPEEERAQKLAAIQTKEDEQRFARRTRLITGLKADKRVNNFLVVSNSLQRIRVTSDNAAGDVSLVFSFMKMLDPTSVVRESEQATARNAAGVPARIRVMYNNALKGDSLDATTRTEFREEAEKIFGQASKDADKVVKTFETRALDERVDPRFIRESIFGPPEVAASQLSNEELLERLKLGQ